MKEANLTKAEAGGGADDPAVVTLSPHEWAEFGISDLRMDHYVCIKVGTGSSARKCYLKPAGRDLTVNMYSTTIQVIVSGICKLSGIARMPAGSSEMVVFRGLAGVRLPEALVEKDEQGFAGVVDASFMSATTDEDLARKYSTAHPGRAATVFKLLLGKKSLGADMSWVSQFAGEREVLFAPRTHLQVVGEPVVGSGGVCVITVRPTTYQNVATVEEVMASRKEGMRHLCSSLVWDLRNEAVRHGKLDPGLAQRLDAFQGSLVARFCRQEAGWYNDDTKYKGFFGGLMSAVKDERGRMYDGAGDALRAGDRVELHSLQAKPEYNGKCGTLVAFKAESGRWEVDLDGGGSLHVKEANLTKAVGAQGKKAADGDASSGEADPAMVAKMLEILSKRAGQGAPVSSTNEVAVLHGKFAQDPNFRKAKFGSDDLFAMGLVAVVGPMDVQYVRAMYNEHCTGSDACMSFTAWNAGHVLETTPLQEWLFVVGREGVDLDSWQVVVGKAEPEVGAGMMVSGRNAKRLADLLQTGAARRAGLAPAEVIAVRLYTGPMYVKYNLVLRAGGHGCYATTIHVICSALQKLSRVTPPPLGLIVYRGTAGKCHFSFMHICMCACACVRACVRACVGVAEQRQPHRHGAGPRVPRARPAGLHRRVGARLHVDVAEARRGARLHWHTQGQGRAHPLRNRSRQDLYWRRRLGAQPV